jgi:DNA-binding NarL/FixJ family response regulator
MVQSPVVPTLLADARHLHRAGLRLLLEQATPVRVVSETDDGLAVPNLVAEHGVTLALLAHDLPNVRGMDLLPLLRRRFPDLRLVLLTGQADPQVIAAARRAGADAVLPATTRPSALEKLLAAVMAPIPSAVPAPVDISPGPRSTPLPDRQRQLLELIGQGYSMREIANLLGISIKTVETHRARLMQALQLRHGNDLIRFAVQQQTRRASA